MGRYFITGGGTGGHIYPAIAVAEALSLDNEDIFYIGNPKNLEYDIVAQKGFKFLGVNVHGMPRRVSLDLLKWGMQLALAVLKSCYYIKKYKVNQYLIFFWRKLRDLNPRGPCEP